MKFDLGPNPLSVTCPDRKSLQDIEDALERLDRGNFGYCESCGARISVKRLCADPTISLCSKCEVKDAVEGGD